MKYAAAGGGVIAVVIGIALLAIGLNQVAGGPAYSDCVGDGCFDDPTVLAIPIGIVALVIGMIAGGWGLSSIRSDRGVTGPLSAFGFMTGLGLVFFVLGWICLFEARQNDGDGTFLFLGVLFGLMGLGFMASDAWSARGIARRDRLRASGLKGTATVVGEKDSNWTVNNNPMVNLTLEVNLPGQAPFRTTKRTVISRLSVGALMPGAVLPVLADPANPKNVTIDWDLAASTGPDLDAGLAGGMSGGLPAGLSGLSFSGLQGSTHGSGTLDPELLRNLGQAMTALAARAQAGQPLGATTIMVNGQQLNLGAPGADGGSPRIVSLPGHVLPTIVNLGSGGFGSAMTPGNAAGAGSSPTALTGSPPGSAPDSGSAPSPASGSIADLGASAGFSAAASAVSPGPAAGTGEAGRVTLDTIRDTGIDIGGARLYTFEMTVAITGRSGFQVKHAALVPQAQVPRLVQGASFPARIDPAQPSNLTVEWDH